MRVEKISGKKQAQFHPGYEQQELFNGPAILSKEACRKQFGKQKKNRGMGMSAADQALENEGLLSMTESGMELRQYLKDDTKDDRSA
ncbi:hypothetical protein ACFL96_00315 [Thermoproteota archaeon]